VEVARSAGDGNDVDVPRRSLDHTEELGRRATDYHDAHTLLVGCEQFADGVEDAIYIVAL
jgi:hypothetical protein